MKIHELGHVVLFVSDLEKMANFYRDILGFPEIMRDNQTAMFTTGRTHHELLLIEVGGAPKEKTRPTPGLYHIGFKIGNTDDELRVAIKTLQEKNVSIVGTADHTVTHSLYIMDPDGNELELYVDINDEWKKDPLLVASPTRRLEL